MKEVNKNTELDKIDKKIHIFGAGTGLDAIEKAKKVLELKGEVEIICVENMEDIPFSERIKSDPSFIQQIYELKDPPIILVAYFETDKKEKGHERPYKYHR